MDAFVMLDVPAKLACPATLIVPVLSIELFGLTGELAVLAGPHALKRGYKEL
jgi:hypothetical protein